MTAQLLMNENGEEFSDNPLKFSVTKSDDFTAYFKPQGE